MLSDFIASSSFVFAQDDLFDVLDKETPEDKNKDVVTSTFKGTRILNGHSIENRKDKELEFIIESIKNMPTESRIKMISFNMII